MVSSYKLVSLFSMIEYGDIRVPAFQRPYSWKRMDILNLLESIYNGFPIGTLIFLNSPKKMFETANPALTGFPDVPERYPVKYVIDGVQRLSTIYNCFKKEPSRIEANFDVVFDFNSQQFIHRRDKTTSSAFLPLPFVFSSEAIIEIEKKSTSKEEYQSLMSKFVELQDKLMNYEVMTNIISDYSVDDTIHIFTAINTAGVRLGKEDLVRAEKRVKTRGGKKSESSINKPHKKR